MEDAVVKDSAAAEPPKDANDYSRFDDSYSVSSDSDDDDGGKVEMPPTERVARAESCKDAGNEHFKNKENTEAVKMYTKALNFLEPLEKLKAPGIMESIKTQQLTLQISLYLNKAAVSNRLDNWSDAIECCTKAIKAVDTLKPENAKASRVKALFRRGFARSRNGDLVDAKTDFVALLKIDRSNKDALREYTKVKNRLAKHLAEEKKQFASAFQKASSGSGMYGDKEEARKRKELARIEAERKRREQWTKETAEEGSELSFEEWCKADDLKKEAERKKEAEKEKERKKKAEEERVKRVAEARRKREEEGDNDEIELDEEDLKAIAETKKKGYCYFKTEHTEEEKRLLASTTGPTKLDSHESTNGSDKPVSAWNANGTTWEERDISDIAREELTSALSGTVMEKEFEGIQVKGRVRSVEKVEGHTQIIVTRGKPAPIFDLSAKLKWELESISDAESLISHGSMEFLDISNGVERGSYDVQTKISKKFTAQESTMHQAISSFHQHLAASIDAFIEQLQTKK